MDEASRHDDVGTFATDHPEAGMPPEHPRPMTSQQLTRFDASSRRVPVDPARARSAAWRRLAVLGSSLALGAYAVTEMWRALAVGHLTVVAVAVLLLFAVNFTWITVPLVTSLVGFGRVVARRRGALPADRPLSTRTALLMPTYNEDPPRVAAALEAMARELVARGEGHAFDFFLLSDSTRGDVALAEEEAFRTLRSRLGNGVRVCYRRRAQNIDHKPGNIRDFCERWGRAYDHLVILDADSLMESAALVALAQRMEADPDAGLIQTLPRLHRGTTLLARLQQFAGSVYGPLLGDGLAWWTRSEGNFWGHNAIVRTEAFMACAGLPVLSGKPPFGGPILSHDFVEAALLRRGGWTVSIASDLEGSYEEGPSSIVDVAIRDRRWCQGNLQHARVLAAKGLHWVSRLHLVAGIMSYVASPIWLLFVMSALALGVQYESARQQYFSHAPTLFPLWPRIDPERALRLFAVTMGVLFGPKVLGWLSVVVTPRRVREHGGFLRVNLGFALEVLLSALIAPLQALIHCGVIADVLRGRSSGWRAQRREGASLPWPVALYAHRWHAVAGVALALAAASISWTMLAWLAPAVVGMVLAAPLSKVVASTALGRAVRRIGLLRTPEETSPPATAQFVDLLVPAYRAALEETPDLAALVSDARLLERHLALVDRAPPAPGRRFDALEAVAEKKIREAWAVEEAIATLTPEEQARVLARPSLLRLLASVRERAERSPAAGSTRAKGPWWGHAGPHAPPGDFRGAG
jgi:membrane glycosyltransferase